MVKKSTLVYDFLRNEKVAGGFTETEIYNGLINKYHLNPGKRLRQLINVALKRGINFGVVVKNANKYSFDVDSSFTSLACIMPKHGLSRLTTFPKVSQLARKTKTRSSSSTRKSQRSLKSSRTRRTSEKRTAQKRKKSRPRIPLPRGSFLSQRKRKLIKEPIPKFIKR